MKFHRSNMKTEGGVRKSLKFGLILQVFGPKSGLKSKNSEFRVNDLMRTVSRNIPMKFHLPLKSGGTLRPPKNKFTQSTYNFFYFIL